MALYNEILTGRHNRFVQKLFGMKGRPPAPQLSGDVQLSQPFFHGAENRFIESWNLWAGSVLIPANAANVNQFRMRNPALSAVIAVVEKLTIFSSAIAPDEVDVSFLATNADLTVFASQARDTRLGLVAQSPIQLSQTNVTTGAGTPFDRVSLGTNVPTTVIAEENQELVLSPGFALVVQGTVANINMGVTVYWRERPMEEGERS